MRFISRPVLCNWWLCKLTNKERTVGCSNIVGQFVIALYFHGPVLHALKLAATEYILNWVKERKSPTPQAMQKHIMWDSEWQILKYNTFQSFWSLALLVGFLPCLALFASNIDKFYTKINHGYKYFMANFTNNVRFVKAFWDLMKTIDVWFARTIRGQFFPVHMVLKCKPNTKILL